MARKASFRSPDKNKVQQNILVPEAKLDPNQVTDIRGAPDVASVARAIKRVGAKAFTGSRPKPKPSYKPPKPSYKPPKPLPSTPRRNSSTRRRAS